MFAVPGCDYTFATTFVRGEGVQYNVLLYDAMGMFLRELPFTEMNLARKVNDVGVLELTIPGEDVSVAMLRPDYRIEVWRTSASAGTVLEGETAWLIRKIREKPVDDADNVEIVVTAEDGIGIINRRIVPYNRGNVNLNADKVAPADTMMYEIMLENFGRDAMDEARNIEEYLEILPPSGSAPQIYKSFSRKNVLKTFQDIVKASKFYGTYLAFDMIYNPGKKIFSFRTYVGQRGMDLYSSGFAIGPQYGDFSELELVYDYTDMYNYVYAGGISIGDIRAVYEIGDDVSIAISPYHRIEKFVNASNTDDLDELKDAANTAIENGVADIYLRGKLTISSSAYHRALSFGDRIGVQYKKDLFIVRIDAYNVSVRDGVEEVTVNFESER